MAVSWVAPCWPSTAASSTKPMPKHVFLLEVIRLKTNQLWPVSNTMTFWYCFHLVQSVRHESTNVFIKQKTGHIVGASSHAMVIILFNTTECVHALRRNKQKEIIEVSHARGKNLVKPKRCNRPWQMRWSFITRHVSFNMLLTWRYRTCLTEITFLESVLFDIFAINMESPFFHAWFINMYTRHQKWI